MEFLRLLCTCVVRERCPCCGSGRLFAGVLRFHAACSACGLQIEQWRGEWITPTYIASSVGMLAGFGLMAALYLSGRGLDGPVPLEVVVGGAAALAAGAALRPSKSFWVAFLYWIGALEVSAETRARLRWAPSESPETDLAERAAAADRRARSVHPPQEAARALPSLHRFVSLRESLFPRPFRPWLRRLKPPAGKARSTAHGDHVSGSFPPL
ncbi:MAG TPA: DUF983 domain-containing protein [Myxococcota bacterium]|nr:DUF983 domain-containing protein [Myxococcota bacterium]